MCKKTSMFKEIVIHEYVMEWIIKDFAQPCSCQEMVLRAPLYKL